MKNQKNAVGWRQGCSQWGRAAVRRYGARLCCLWPPLCVVLARLRQVAFRFAPESLELQTGALAISVGLWLALASAKPGQNAALLGRLGTHLWPVPLWGVAFAFVGLAQILALRRERVRARCLCAMSGFCLWAFLFVLAVLDGVAGLGVALFPLIALSEAWVYLRLGVSPGSSRSDQPLTVPEHPSASTSPADIHS